MPFLSKTQVRWQIGRHLLVMAFYFLSSGGAAKGEGVWLREEGQESEQQSWTPPRFSNPGDRPWCRGAPRAGRRTPIPAPCSC